MFVSEFIRFSAPSGSPLPPDSVRGEPLGLRERSKKARWQRIIRAARESFREQGYEATTIRMIAARAEVGVGTIFDYVRNKSDLLSKIFDRDLEELTDRCISTMPAGIPLQQQLLHFFAPRYTYWAADPVLSRLAAQNNFPSTVAERVVYSGADLFHARRARTVTFLTQLVNEHRLSGAVNADLDAETVGKLLLDVYLGAMRRWLSEDAPDPAAGVRELDVTLAIVLRGILTAPSL